MGEWSHSSYRRPRLHTVCKRHSTNVFALPNSSAWLMIHSKQPGRELRQGIIGFALLPCIGCIKEKELAVEPVQERNFTPESAAVNCFWEHELGLHITTVGMAGPRVNPATQKACVIFFIRRTQIPYTVIASQMGKLRHREHIGMTSWWATEEPQARLRCPPAPGSECMQNPSFLLCLWKLSAWWRQHG